MYPNVTDRPSNNFDQRKHVTGHVTISMLVIHYTGMQSCEQALERLCDPKAKVSSHLLIDEDGTIYRLIEENQRAWHAGRAYWRGIHDINSVSIGIELVNPGHEFGYRDFPNAQIGSLIDTAKDIVARYNIPPTGIVGHSDIAPGRKTDPGERFPWQYLASNGLGLWPPPSNEKSITDSPWDSLAAIGYPVPDNPSCGGDILAPSSGQKDVITAFQRRFLPHHLLGLLDEITTRRIAAVAAIYR